MTLDAFKSPRTEALIFDFGGTLDTGGYHWFEIFVKAYRSAGIAVSRDSLYETYVFAERQLSVAGRVTPDMSFHDLTVLKCQIQLGWLAHNGLVSWDEAERAVLIIASCCLDTANASTTAVTPVLKTLSERFPMAVVSNFYGNLDTVLRQNGLRKFFSVLVDSASIGVRKPDSRIFSIAVTALGVAPEAVTVIGDSYKNDIIPALETRCRAILIDPEGKSQVDNDNIQVFDTIKSLDNLLI